MKSKYWIIENGVEKKATKEEFKQWYNDFTVTVMDEKGNICDKNKIPFNEVEGCYNPQGIMIAGKNITY